VTVPGGLMLTSRRIPVGIALLFAIDASLVLAALLDYLAGSPFSQLRNWLNLDSEFSLPAWYSSMQWFCAAFLFGCISISVWRHRAEGMWALATFSLLCLAFSIDEILGIHEWLGRQSDALLPGGDRHSTSFTRTGIWPLLIGIPVVTVLAVLLIFLQRMFVRTARTACIRLVAGVVIMFTGALIVELGSNVVAAGAGGDGLVILQLATEELLEMVGVTFIVWAAYEFALAHGLAITLPAHVASTEVLRQPSTPLLEPAVDLLHTSVPVATDELARLVSTQVPHVENSPLSSSKLPI
jgi:hypothetical protein